jgi:hypothetical protein
MARTLRFTAHCDLEGRHRSHTVEAENALDAAVTFAEHWLPQEDGAAEVKVIVEDCETGERQCYVVDLGDFDAEPCPPADR